MVGIKLVIRADSIEERVGLGALLRLATISPRDLSPGLEVRTPERFSFCGGWDLLAPELSMPESTGLWSME